MAMKKNLSPAKAVPNHKKLKEARKMQYGKDYPAYELFARIWGWDGYEADHKQAVKQLAKYIEKEERKTNTEKQRPRDPELQFYVGVAYLSNWIPCEDSDAYALDWFERSSQQGSDKGALGVGYLMEINSGTDKDTYRKMVDQYTQSAKQGNMYAQYRLAKILHQWDPDNPRLVQMLMNAADAGYEPAKTLLTKINQRPQKEKAKVVSARDYDDLNAKIQKLLDMASENLLISRRMEQKLDALQSSMNGMWDDLRRTEAEHERYITELQQSVNNALKEAIALPRPKGSNPDIMVDAEKFMALIFREDWRKPDRLCDESCDALVTAHVLMSVAEELRITNFSGIVITAVWALEYECRRRFRDAFDRYLESLGVQQMQIRADRMNLKYNKKEDNAEFTLGSTYYVVNPFGLKKCRDFETASEFDAFAEACGLLSAAAKKIKKDRKYKDAGMVFWDYWIPGYRDSDGYNMSFTRILYELNEKYRVPAAHAELVSREAAAECCKMLGITEVHQDMNSVTGALKTLLWLTAPLDESEK